VIGPYDVYMDQVHVSATYATYLRKVLAQALFNPTPTPTHFVQADSTSVVKPFGGATLSGVSLLDATAVLGSSSVEKVDFQLSGGGLHNQSICAGSKSLFGWFCRWNSSTVANGRYTLHVIASYESGESRQSKPISLSVKN
jgi:hypothetical protein